jgi:hypothetical protein
MFSNLFACCSTYIKNSNESSFKEKTENEMDTHIKDNFDNNKEEIKNNNNSINSNNNSNNKNNNNNNKNISSTPLEKKIKEDELNLSNFSNITFSNMKVKDSKTNTLNFDTEVLSTQELKLVGKIFWNKDVYIDRFGLKSGNRKKKNGIVIFGIGKNEDKIDFVINISKLKLKNIDKYIQLFSIEYDKIEERFKLRILKNDIKILLTLDYEYFFEKEKNIEIIAGKIQMLIDTSKTDNGLINIKVEDKNYEFNKENDLPITIGRNNCKININNNSISKNHAIIDYNAEYHLFYIKDLGSTNKTYFVIRNGGNIKINRDMNLKLFESKFSIKIIE